MEGSYREYHKGSYSAATMHPTEAEQEAQRMRAAVCSLVGLRPLSESGDRSLSEPGKPGTEGGSEGVEEGGGEECEETEGIAEEGGAGIGEEGESREVRYARTSTFGVQVLGNIVLGYIHGVCFSNVLLAGACVYNNCFHQGYRSLCGCFMQQAFVASVSCFVCAGLAR